VLGGSEYIISLFCITIGFKHHERFEESGVGFVSISREFWSVLDRFGPLGIIFNFSERLTLHCVTLSTFADLTSFRGSWVPPPEADYIPNRQTHDLRPSSQRELPPRPRSPSALDEISYLVKSAKAAITGSPPPPIGPPPPIPGNKPAYRPSSQQQDQQEYYQTLARDLETGNMGSTYQSRSRQAHRDEQFFGQYTHLDTLPSASFALLTLRRLASAVMPIMRKRGWKVGTLSEFYPDQPGLLGLNVNHGQQIMVRLRSPFNVQSFLPFEHTLDTLLHE
jgi:hypothetical protein